jgi:hypothetical protein
MQYVDFNITYFDDIGVPYDSKLGLRYADDYTDDIEDRKLVDKS